MPLQGLMLTFGLACHINSYSGVSWAVNDHDHSASGTRSTRAVNLIENWPDPGSLNRTSNKVPSAISYEKDDLDKVASWGFHAIRNQQYKSSTETETFTWFKLLLQTPHTGAEEIPDDLEKLKALLRKYKKTAFQVSVDYLRELWRYALDQIRRTLGDGFEDDYSIQAVLTVPALWTPTTAHLTGKLAKEAGLPENTLLLPEPEAAAVTILKVSSQRAKLVPGDVITVFDAGGGTWYAFQLFSDIRGSNWLQFMEDPLLLIIHVLDLLVI